jgi:hypothetical protein
MAPRRARRRFRHLHFGVALGVERRQGFRSFHVRLHSLSNTESHSVTFHIGK